MFVISLISVAIMLGYAAPGFALVKARLIKEESISDFAVLLMYVCQFFLAIYTFQQADFTWRIFANMGIAFGIGLFVMGLFLAIFYLVYRRRYSDVKFRIANLSSACGNVTFMGVPLLQALLPESPEALAYSSVLFIAMNILCWTVGSTMITRDKKYCKPQKALLNPAVIGLVVALPLFFTGLKLPAQLADAVSIIGRMSTPLCMLILGMRLGTVKFKEFFCDAIAYISMGVKLVLVPLAAFALMYFMPIDRSLKAALYIMFCCPVASVVLNFAEMLKEGQKSAANTVLLSTIASVITIPLLLMLIEFL